jgi:Ca2+-binding EF-hand superfamily protein
MKTIGMKGSLAAWVIAAMALAGCSGAVQDDGSTAADHADLSSSASPLNTTPSSSAAPEAQGADAHHGRHGKWMERWDKDGDGNIVLSDVPDGVREHLAKADKDGDGIVTREELRAAREERKAEFQAKADTNHDGTVSPEERRAAFESFAKARFAERDKNGDGALTADEVGERRWARLAKADANGDGKVTEDEIRAAFANGVLGFRGRHHHGGDQGPAPADGTTTL